MTTNDALLQMQADLLGTTVMRPAVTETTALGAAYLAGLSIGFWRDTAQVSAQWTADANFEPRISADERESLRTSWHRAVARVRSETVV